MVENNSSDDKKKAKITALIQTNKDASINYDD